MTERKFVAFIVSEAVIGTASLWYMLDCIASVYMYVYYIIVTHSLYICDRPPLEG
jgi:hypothetical protein